MDATLWQKILDLCDKLSNVTYENLTKIIRLDATGSATGARNLDDSDQNDVDTVVSIDGRILGKPKDKADARQMLRLLSGRTHTVYSGFTLIGQGQTSTESVATNVAFASMSEREIENYIASGEPTDKAGAYGIQGQGGLFVTGIEGDYYTVVGLPLQRIYIALRDVFGVDFQ